MDRSPIPEKLKRFILLAVPSVPYLEAVLLLQGNPQKSWASSEFSQRLYLNDAAAETLFNELKAGGILTSDQKDSAHFRYQPKTEELREMPDLLATVYPKNLVDVTNLIHSKVNKKARLFADAFVLRKD